MKQQFYSKQLMKLKVDLRNNDVLNLRIVMNYCRQFYCRNINQRELNSPVQYKLNITALECWLLSLMINSSYIVELENNIHS